MGSDAPLVVVDASVAVKWLVSADESGVEAAGALLRAHARGTVRLVGPALIAYEVFAVLGRDRRHAGGLAEGVDAFFDADVAMVTPDRELMLRAAEHVRLHGVSVFDSAYSALAESLGCDLATADRKLARRLEGFVPTRVV